MLTDLQHKVLAFIARYQRENHLVTPTYRTIAASLGMGSTNSAHRIVVALEQEGCLRRLPNKKQAIEVLPLGFWHLKEAA